MASRFLRFDLVWIVFDSSSLSSSRCFLYDLAACTDTDGLCRRSVSCIGALSGLSPRHSRRIFGSLVAQGIVERVFHHGLPCLRLVSNPSAPGDSGGRREASGGIIAGACPSPAPKNQPMDGLDIAPCVFPGRRRGVRCGKPSVGMWNGDAICAGCANRLGIHIGGYADE
jgi:hypothetical protein